VILHSEFAIAIAAYAPLIDLIIDPFVIRSDDESNKLKKPTYVSAFVEFYMIVFDKVKFELIKENPFVM